MVTSKARSRKKTPTTRNTQIEAELSRIVEYLAQLSGKIDVLLSKQRDNLDTSPQETEAYTNKIARMLLDRRFTAAYKFLRSVYGFIETTGAITRKQICAVDRIELSGKREAGIILEDSVGNSVFAEFENDWGNLGD